MEATRITNGQIPLSTCGYLSDWLTLSCLSGTLDDTHTQKCENSIKADNNNKIKENNNRSIIGTVNNK